ncbi:hypothetical protein ACUNGS_18320, partial [Serratia sp. IR-2025]
KQIQKKINRGRLDYKKKTWVGHRRFIFRFFSFFGCILPFLGGGGGGPPTTFRAVFVSSPK